MSKFLSKLTSSLKKAEVQDNNKTKTKYTKRKEYVHTLACDILGETEKAYKVSLNKGITDFFVPKSIVEVELGDVNIMQGDKIFIPGWFLSKCESIDLYELIKDQTAMVPLEN